MLNYNDIDRDEIHFMLPQAPNYDVILIVIKFGASPFGRLPLLTPPPPQTFRIVLSLMPIVLDPTQLHLVLAFLCEFFFILLVSFLHKNLHLRWLRKRCDNERFFGIRTREPLNARP